MLTFRVELDTGGVDPLVVPVPPVEAVEPDPAELEPVEPVEPVDVPEPPDVPVDDVVPVEGDVDGAPLEPPLPVVPDPTPLVEPPPSDVPEPPLFARTLVTTNASAANDTCLELNSAICPVVDP
jgi:hypothetical protein